MVPAARSAWAWLYHRGYIKALFSTTTPTTTPSTTPSTITYFYSHMTNATPLSRLSPLSVRPLLFSLFLSYAVLFFFSSPHLFLLFFSPPTILPLSQLLLKESRALIREVSISFDLSLTLLLFVCSPRVS